MLRYKVPRSGVPKVSGTSVAVNTGRGKAKLHRGAQPMVLVTVATGDGQSRRNWRFMLRSLGLAVVEVCQELDCESSDCGTPWGTIPVVVDASGVSHRGEWTVDATQHPIAQRTVFGVSGLPNAVLGLLNRWERQCLGLGGIADSCLLDVNAPTTHRIPWQSQGAGPEKQKASKPWQGRLAHLRQLASQEARLATADAVDTAKRYPVAVQLPVIPLPFVACEDGRHEAKPMPDTSWPKPMPDVYGPFPVMHTITGL